MLITFSGKAYTLKHLGCWRDSNERAISGRERSVGNNHGIVNGCMMFADDREWTVFAVQDQGQCFTAENAGDTYTKHGRADGCINGRGSVWMQDVYEIISSFPKGNYVTIKHEFK